MSWPATAGHPDDSSALRTIARGDAECAEWKITSAHSASPRESFQERAEPTWVARIRAMTVWLVNDWREHISSKTSSKIVVEKKRQARFSRLTGGPPPRSVFVMVIRCASRTKVRRGVFFSTLHHRFRLFRFVAKSRVGHASARGTQTNWRTRHDQERRVRRFRRPRRRHDLSEPQLRRPSGGKRRAHAQEPRRLLRAPGRTARGSGAGCRFRSGACRAGIKFHERSGRARPGLPVSPRGPAFARGTEAWRRRLPAGPGRTQPSLSGRALHLASPSRAERKPRCFGG